MKQLLKFEELALLALTIFLFARLPYPWWLYLALLMLPDLSMAGYATNNKAGAIIYNLVHHRGIAIVAYLAGSLLANDPLMLAGIILLAHSTMDRIFGYGLKHFRGFKYTSSGEIGNG